MPETVPSNLDVPTIRGVGGEPQGWSEAARNRDDRRLMDHIIEALSAQRRALGDHVDASDALARGLADAAAELEALAARFPMLRPVTVRVRRLHGALAPQVREARALIEPTRVIAALLEQSAALVHQRRLRSRDNPEEAGRRALSGVTTAEMTHVQRRDAHFLFVLGAADGLDAEDRLALAKMIVGGAAP
jgi:hypothetical protein